MAAGRRIATLSLALSLGALTACSNGARGPRWVDPSWSEDFSFLPSATRSQLLWQSGQARLFSSENASQLVNDDSKLVMVTYKPDHPDRRLIEESPGLRALDRQGSLHHALLALQDQAHVDDLAARLHGHDDGFLSCGRVVRLGFTQTYDAAFRIPAVYPDIIKLDAVSALLEEPQANAIKADVQALESLGTRYHNASNGAEVTSTVKTMLETAGAGITGFAVTTVDHSEVLVTKQQSVVATIPGTTDASTLVIFGAHFDSINYSDQNNAPGADDDASGVATLTAMIRAIAATGSTFARTLEFHAYAAEEVGLEGSRHIAERYAEENKKVVGMFQIDMNTFSQEAGDKTIWLLSNSTHLNLRRSLKDLMHSYIDGDFKDGALTGGTSDHESWSAHGFPAVFPFENPQGYNQALHSENDTSTTAANFDLATRFAQLGLAFASHYAGLDAAQAEFEAKKTAALATFDNDLKLAITLVEEGQFHVAVATRPDVKQVSVCTAQEAGSRRCFANLVETDPEDPIGDRSVFATSAALTLADDDRLVVFGYDSADKIIAQRTVKLIPH